MSTIARVTVTRFAACHSAVIALLAVSSFAVPGLAATTSLADDAKLAAGPRFAIVSTDATPLRAAAHDRAQQQVQLWQGDIVELRGERLNFLQVYDHRHERAGFVRAAQVRPLSTAAGAAPALAAVVQFLRDSPGLEAQGIAYGAAYLKAAPAEAIGAEIFDALGVMAERLADRASFLSSGSQPRTQASTNAHLEVAASYGIHMFTVLQGGQGDGRVYTCYDGEAYRRVLSLPATAEQTARATLALTRPECQDPELNPLEKYALVQAQAELLDQIPMTDLPGYWKNRLHIRRAGLWAGLAFQHARRGADALSAGQRALAELAAVNKSELAEDDKRAYSEAAIRVGASRWAAEPLPVAKADTAPVAKAASTTGTAKSGTGKASADSRIAANTAANTALNIITRPGETGQTCVALVDGSHGVDAPLVQRCTYAQIWIASARSNAQNSVLTLAVQPLESWRELWVFQRRAEGWVVEVMPPSTDAPELGYVEFAGWLPGATQMLTARESKTDNRVSTRFELIDLATLNVQKHADQPGSLTPFYRWQDPLWKSQTVSLR